MSGTTTAAEPTQPVSPEPIWAKPAVSVYAMTIFIIALGIAYMAKDSSSLTMMMGAAISMGSTVINYWLGSSSGSAKKTDLIGSGATPPPPTPSVVRTETTTTATPVTTQAP